MIVTALIAFREFLEAFVIAGIFYGISKRSSLKKEREIILGALLGMVSSLFLCIGFYWAGDVFRSSIAASHVEALEGCLLVGSGIFLSYVMISLHRQFQKARVSHVRLLHSSLKEDAVDVPIVILVASLVLREGFEIALFTASTSLVTSFLVNMSGLVLGFIAAIAVGSLGYFLYSALPVTRIFTVTQYVLVFLGASLTTHGISLLSEIVTGVSLSGIVPFSLSFLPDEESLFGHAISTFFGIGRQTGVGVIAGMAVYSGIMLYFLHKKIHATRSV